MRSRVHGQVDVPGSGQVNVPGPRASPCPERRDDLAVVLRLERGDLGNLGATAATGVRPPSSRPFGRGPVPMWHGPDRVEIRVGLGERVLLGDVRAEFEMLTDRLPERGVLRQAGFV